MNCPKCKSPLLWSEDRGVNCDGCEYDPTEEELIWIEQLAACKKELSEEQLKCHAAEERAEQAEAKVERLEGEVVLLKKELHGWLFDLHFKCAYCGEIYNAPSGYDASRPLTRDDVARAGIEHMPTCKNAPTGKLTVELTACRQQLHQAIAQRDEARGLLRQVVYHANGFNLDGLRRKNLEDDTECLRNWDRLVNRCRVYVKAAGTTGEGKNAPH